MIATSIITIIIISGVSGIYLQRFMLSGNYYEWEKINSTINLSISDLYDSHGQEERIEYSSPIEDVVFTDTSQNSKLIEKNAGSSDNLNELTNINECDFQYINDACVFLKELVKKNGVLLYDILNRIKSDPVEITFSDEVNHSSVLRNICWQPISGKIVTYFVYNRTQFYPKWIATNPILSKMFDVLWFYLYFYESPELNEFLEGDCIGRWLLSVKDFISKCFWVEKIDSDITDINGFSSINHNIYYYPGKYNIITLANITSSPICNFLERDCDFFGINPYPRCYDPTEIIDLFLFKIFYDHLTVKREKTLMGLVNYYARYSDINSYTIKLNDDDNYPLLKPYPWNNDNFERNDTILVSDKVNVSFYISLPSGPMYLGTNETNIYGYATLEVRTWIKPGTYDLNVIFEGNKCYLPTSLTSEIIIEKEFTKIEPIQMYEIDNTDDITISSQLLDDDGNGIPQLDDIEQEGRAISFNIEVEGKWKLLGNFTTDSNGWCYLNTSFLLPYGNYNIKILFGGDDYYIESVQYGIIKINQETTIIDIYSDYYEVQTTDSLVLSANLTDDESNPLKFQQVSYQIKINGFWTNISTVYTDDNGTALYVWEVSTKPGGYLIRAIFYEDEFFKESSQEGFIEIQKENTNLKIITVNSKSIEKYEVQAQLFDDDGVPISGEEVTIEVNKNTYKVDTDDNGLAKIKIDNTFGDLAIQAIYHGSTIYKQAQKSHTKKFTTELETFFELSTELMISLLKEFGDNEVLKELNIEKFADLLLEILNDLRDGKLDDYLRYLNEFAALLGSEYFISAFFSNAFFKFPWTDGLASVFFEFIDAANQVWDDWAPFSPSPSEGVTVSLGQKFSATHTFFNVVEWIEEDAGFDWEFDKYIGWDDLIKILGYTVTGSGEKIIGEFKYVWKFVSGVFDSAKKYKKDWYDIWHLFDKPLSKSFTLQLSDLPTDELREFFETSLTKEFFWEKINGLWYLGFDHLLVGEDELLQGFLDLLDLIGVNLWEIFQFLLSLLNSQKAEHLKQLFKSKESMLFSRIEDEASNGISEMVSILPDINILNNIDITDYFSNDLISQELDIHSTLSIAQISLDDNEVTNLEDLLSEMLPAINLNFGMMLSTDNLMEIVDLLENWPTFDVNLEDLGIDLSWFEGLEFQIDHWDQQEIERFSEIMDLIQQIIDATPFPEFFKKLSEADSFEEALWILFSYFLEFIQPDIYYDTAEAIIDVIAKNDLLFFTKKDADLFLSITQIIDLIRSGISIIDGISDESVLDEFSSLLLSILQGATGTLAAYLSDDEVFEIYSEYYAKEGFSHIPNNIIEFLVDLVGKRIFANYGQTGDCVADIAHAIVKTIKVCIDLIWTHSTFDHFNQVGEIHAWTMSINHFVKRFASIVIGISEILIEKIPYYIKVFTGVVYVYLVSLGGQTIFTYLAINGYY